MNDQFSISYCGYAVCLGNASKITILIQIFFVIKVISFIFCSVQCGILLRLWSIFLPNFLAKFKKFWKAKLRKWLILTVHTTQWYSIRRLKSYMLPQYGTWTTTRILTTLCYGNWKSDHDSIFHVIGDSRLRFLRWICSNIYKKSSTIPRNILSLHLQCLKYRICPHF